MSNGSPRVLTSSLESETLAPSSSIAERLIRRLLGGMECGELVIETPHGSRIVLRGARPEPHASLTLHSWRVLIRLLSGWDIGFAEAYMAREWSSPNLTALLTLAVRNSRIEERPKLFRTPQFALKIRHALNRNTRRGSRRNIAAHYDLGNDFYERWLDAGMTYSAALFSAPEQTLEDAQKAKFDRVLELLEPQRGERVLEIGCGWGSFAERLLGKHACTMTGLTLSAEQLRYAQRRLSDEIAAGRSDLRLQDYRDVIGVFDRIVSIEMIEAVGETYWPTYFDRLNAMLRPGGVAVLQAITISEERFESYRRRPDFIQKHIFPGGMLPTPAIIERKAAEAGLRLVKTELFGDSYARTLEQWNARFQEAWPDIKALGYDARFKRMWEYYLSYCQVGFDSGALNVGLFKLIR